MSSMCNHKRFSYKGEYVNHNTLFCTEGHESTLPNIAEMAVGYIFLLDSKLFTGQTFQWIQEFMKIPNISFISHTTFNNVQKIYLFLTSIVYTQTTVNSHNRYCIGANKSSFVKGRKVWFASIQRKVQYIHISRQELWLYPRFSCFSRKNSGKFGTYARWVKKRSEAPWGLSFVY